MPEIRIGDRPVGDGHPAFIIAEIGVNHNGILELAFQLIDAARAETDGHPGLLDQGGFVEVAF